MSYDLFEGELLDALREGWMVHKTEEPVKDGYVIRKMVDGEWCMRFLPMKRHLDVTSQQK